MRLAARHAAKQALLQKQCNAVNKLRDVEVSVNRLQFEGHDLFQLVASMRLNWLLQPGFDVPSPRTVQRWEMRNCDRLLNA